LTGPAVSAQAPPSSRFPVIPLQPDPGLVAPAQVEPGWTPTPATKLIVDTDPGVDDAVALVWLLAQTQDSEEPSALEVLGIVATAGNTSVNNAARNVLQILEWMELDGVPVFKGAAKPWNVARSLTGVLIHGADGLWGAADPALDISRLGTNANQFYCRHAEPGLTILALGPLTSVASAVRSCRDRMAGVQIISLGGARGEGNQTAVTEFNYWQDPDAADFLLSNSLRYGYHFTLVPVHAFSQLVVTLADLAVYPAGLVGAVAQYFALTTGTDGGLLPDVVAAVYAVNPELVLPGDTSAAAVNALVKVVSGGDVPEFARGQTVMAYDPTYVPDPPDPNRFVVELGFWLTLAVKDRDLSRLIEPALRDALADGQFTLEESLAIMGTFFGVLQTAPPNATVVDQVDAAAILGALGGVSLATGSRSSITAESGNATGKALDEPSNWLYLPLLSDQ
jgi:inosine-uridine nucleoside N-ribohydrolase